MIRVELLTVVLVGELLIIERPVGHEEGQRDGGYLVGLVVGLVNYPDPFLNGQQHISLNLLSAG